MSTTLFALIDAGLHGNRSLNYFDYLVHRLIGFDGEFYPNEPNQVIFDKETYDFDNFEEVGYSLFPCQDSSDDPFCVDFETHINEITPTIYDDVTYMSLPHRFDAIYRTQDAEYAANDKDWYLNLRRNLFRVINILGGTEVIYVADNSLDILGEALEGLAMENVPYHQIKAWLTQIFGSPVTDYSLLDYEALDYRNMTEFFVDDFSDLKQSL